MNRLRTPAAVRRLSSITSDKGQLPYVNAYINGKDVEAKRASDDMQIQRRRVINPKSNESHTVAIKDNIATKQIPTTCASKMLENYHSPIEATTSENIGCEQLWRDTVVGKTNMDEFGMGSFSVNSHFGPVGWREEPDQPLLTAGGSSGGSAVAVAFNDVAVALGSDTGGSVRLPAAYVGAHGFKPSYGRISRYGLIPYANSLDTIGIFSNNPADVASSFHQLEGHDQKDMTCVSSESRERFDSKVGSHNYEFHKRETYERLTVGVPREYHIEEMADDVREGWHAALEQLVTEGHKVVEVSLPSTKHALSAYYTIAMAEAASNLAKYDGVRYGHRDAGSDTSNGVLYSSSRNIGFGHEVKRRILLGNYTLSSTAMDNYFLQAQRVRRMVQRDFDRVFALSNPLKDYEAIDLTELDESIELEDKKGPAQVDILLCPTAPTLAPKLEDLEKLSPVEKYMNDVLTVPASLAGIPAYTLPFWLTPTKFVSIQLIAQYWDDEFLLGTAEKLLGSFSKG